MSWWMKGWGIPTPVLAALGGYLFTYYNTRITEERKARIERVNDQVQCLGLSLVRLLYGPLLACVTASKSAFTAMVHQHGDGDAASFVRSARENPEGAQGKIYRQWMREVLQPLNEKAAEIVVKHADMLQSNRMEPLLLQLVAHVSAYRVILARWAEGDLHEWSALSYPDALHAYAEAEFEKMKQMQADLLGIKNGPRAKL